MIQKVKGVVLHHVRYKESSAIVYVYTDQYGRQSYLVNGIRGKKPKFPGSLLQPLTLVKIEAYHKESRDLQRVKEMQNCLPYRTIPFDVYKSSQSLFIAEVLYKALREEDPDQNMFGFLEHSLQFLDLSDEGIVNFHLMFLVKLTKYLGFYPENNYNGDFSGFDMKNGQFSHGAGIHPEYFGRESSELLNSLLRLSFSELRKVSVNQSTKVKFLENIMDFYRFHINGFGTIKSLAVLHEIYREDGEFRSE